MYNKKAKYEYELLDSYTAGIMLTGPEVKAVKQNKVSFTDSFCYIINNEIFVKKLHISIKDGIENQCTRDRKLLLNKKEIHKIQKCIKEKGLTIVPVSIFFNNTNLIKMSIFTAKGKNSVNKKEKIKERDLKRENYI